MSIGIVLYVVDCWLTFLKWNTEVRVQELYLIPVVVTERKYMLTVPRASFAAYTRVTRGVHSVYTHFTRI